MENNSEEIMVSVICLAYNHESFIRQALDGFVNQKTSFKFEVIIHDDASTDNTADIIKEYEEKYPNIIKPIYQIENQYSKKIGITPTYILPKARGKYLAWCEGDDYWIDNNKLQSQVDALEKNNNCSSCITKVESITLNGKEKGVFFPVKDFKTGIILSDDIVNYCLNPAKLNGFPLQISGFMLKREVYYEYIHNPPFYKPFFEVGDIPLFLYSGLVGDAFYIDKVMSHYRTENPNSWIGRTGAMLNEKAKYFIRKAKAYEEFDKFTNRKYHEHAMKAVGYSLTSSYLLTNALKMMKSEEMKEYYDMLSLKQKLRLYIFYYFPWSEKPIRKLLKILRRIKWNLKT